MAPAIRNQRRGSGGLLVLALASCLVFQYISWTYPGAARAEVPSPKAEEAGFFTKVIGAAAQGATAAFVAAILSAVTEPVVNRLLVKRMTRRRPGRGGEDPRDGHRGENCAAALLRPSRSQAIVHALGGRSAASTTSGNRTTEEEEEEDAAAAATATTAFSQARAFEALLSGAPMCLSYISRTHLQLEVQGLGLCMTNVSSNQIYVNSEPVNQGPSIAATRSTSIDGLAKGESRLVSLNFGVISKFFLKIFPTNMLKFPVFEVINIMLTFTSLSGSFRGMINGFLFCTIMLPVTNYRFRKSMGWEITPSALYQAYVPTVARDIVYGWSRGFVGGMMAKSALPKTISFGITVFAACILSSPGNEWRGYTLQPKDKKLPFAEYFKPVNYARSTGIGATIMGVALATGMFITPYVENLVSFVVSLF